ncbi:Uncharacterised protein [Klebsiella quasipneumoniae]|nr:Uncharacterised protein [Klebsiella quasipneumoniae]
MVMWPAVCQFINTYPVFVRHSLDFFFSFKDPELAING